MSTRWETCSSRGHGMKLDQEWEAQRVTVDCNAV